MNYYLVGGMGDKRRGKLYIYIYIIWTKGKCFNEEVGIMNINKVDVNHQTFHVFNLKQIVFRVKEN